MIEGIPEGDKIIEKENYSNDKEKNTNVTR